jgi:hypothetical protein
MENLIPDFLTAHGVVICLPCCLHLTLQAVFSCQWCPLTSLLWGCISCFSHYCDKIPERNNVRGGRVYLGLASEVQPAAVLDQGIMVARMCGVGSAHLMAARKQRKRTGSVPSIFLKALKAF